MRAVVLVALLLAWGFGPQVVGSAGNKPSAKKKRKSKHEVIASSSAVATDFTTSQGVALSFRCVLKHE